MGGLDTHKFDRKAEVTYLGLFRKAFQGTVRLVRLMEEELGESGPTSWSIEAE